MAGMACVPAEELSPSMSVVIEFEEQGACRKQLTIEVPAPAVEAEIGRVVAALRRQIRLPGFRKGRVPEAIVRQRYQEEIEQELTDRLVPRYWKQAQAEKDLDPLMAPRLEELNYTPGEPLTFVASVETRPAIELGDYASFQLPEDDPEPSEQELTEALEDLQRQHSTWSPIERPAARGDMVVGRMRRVDPADAEASDPDAEENAENPVEIEVGDERVWEELTLAVTGLSSGQGADFHRTLGEGETQVRQAFRIEVDAVKERQLPAADDDFAERLGFESAEELRSTLAERLRARKEIDIGAQRRQTLLDQLRERHPMALPEGVVEEESKQLLKEFAESLTQQGVDIESAQIDWVQLENEQARPQAERRVHSRLLLDAIAEKEGLEIDEAEFNGFLARAASAQKQSTFALRRELDRAGRLEAVRAQVLREKTVRFLLGTEEPVDEGGESES